MTKRLILVLFLLSTTASADITTLSTFGFGQNANEAIACWNAEQRAQATATSRCHNQHGPGQILSIDCANVSDQSGGVYTCNSDCTAICELN